ncbi:hypothetical protein V8C34DRAFT_53148 [Trichoderma compactum]
MSSVGLRPRGHLSLPIRRTPGRRSYVFASVVAGPLRGMPPIHSQRPLPKGGVVCLASRPKTRGEGPFDARDWTCIVWGFTISDFSPLFPPSSMGRFAAMRFWFRHGPRSLASPPVSLTSRPLPTRPPSTYLRTLLAGIAPAYPVHACPKTGGL